MSAPKTAPGKLKFYCAVCKKQCGDQLGYDRHCNGTNHLKNMASVGDNTLQYVETSSRQFEEDFLELVNSYHGKKVESNIIYQQLFKNPQHVHLKSTKWTQLTDFIAYLHANNRCHVEFDPQIGYLLQSIDHTDESKSKHSQRLKQVYQQLALEEAKEKRANQQHQFTIISENNDDHEIAEKRQKLNNVDIPQKFNMKVSLNTRNTTKNLNNQYTNDIFDDNFDESQIETSNSIHKQSIENNDGNTTDTSHIQTNESLNDNTDEDDEPYPWIRPGLIVKVTNKELSNGLYYSRKGEITAIFTSIKKELIPVDTSYKDSEKILTSDQDGDFVKIQQESTAPIESQKTICVNYEYAMICEVLIKININTIDQNTIDLYSESIIDNKIHQKILLPEKDVQTVIAKFHPDDDLSPKYHDDIRKYPEVAVVSGKFADITTSKLRFSRVKKSRTASTKNSAFIQLTDSYYKTQPYIPKLHDNDVIKHPKKYYYLNENDNNKSLYNFTVEVSLDDICNTIYT